MAIGALVTGGSSGIGAEVARVLAQAGYHLVLSHFEDDENADQVRHAIIDQYGVRCSVFAGNLADASVPSQLAEYALQEWGTVSVLVNNAGVTRMASVEEFQLGMIDHVFGLNFRAPLLLARDIGNHMIHRGVSGVIINIASTRAFRAYPRDSIYGGLKSALVRATESMALDLARYDIRVNCIAPGAIQVRQRASLDTFYQRLGHRIPLGRVGQPDDVARAVRWLVSEEAAYVTGTTIRVDGGLILPGMPERLPEGTEDYGWGVVRDAPKSET